MINRTKNNFQTGLSLIGVVVAVSILASSAIVLTRLIVETERLSMISRDKFIATNLAREGLELVRVVRDTNSLDVSSEQPWTQYLCGVDNRSIQLYTDSVDNWVRGQTNSPISNGTDFDNLEGYVRHIDIDCDNAETEPRHVIVTSTVTWEHQRNTRDVVVREVLYDWL